MVKKKKMNKYVWDIFTNLHSVNSFLNQKTQVDFSLDKLQQNVTAR